jgi:hypothetical protein
MAKTKRAKDAQSRDADDRTMTSKRDEGWNERLRLVGDARFVEVQWSGRDHPCWPLPKK